MRVESATIYKFYFSYEGTELMIPLASPSPEKAKERLRQLLLQWANELAMPEGTVVSPVQSVKPPEPVPMPDPMVLQLRIEDLVKALVPLKKPRGAQPIERLVKEWTGFNYEPQNYPAIIAELGRLHINEKGE